jgi:hypothetical protein
MVQSFGTAYSMAEGGGQSYTPVRQNHWTITIENIDSELAARSIQFGGTTLEKITLSHFNEEVYYAGKPRAQAITVRFFDPISPDVVNELNSWFTQVYDPETGLMGLPANYKRSGQIFQYTPDGQTIIRTWSFGGAFPLKTPHPPSLTYDSHEPTDVELEMSIDRLILGPSADVGPAS